VLDSIMISCKLCPESGRILANLRPDGHDGRRARTGSA
jgi:hypothetical protein